MFDTIILLTGPVEEVALTGVLRQHNPRLDVRAVKSPEELAAVEPSVLARARLVAFVTPVVVPARILRALGFGAYNFHPGPPHYPGWVPAHFAIYEGAGHFGATAHAMIEQVDAGPIVAFKMFEIPPGTSVMRLQEMAFVELARLFWALAPVLAAQSEPLAALPVEWSGAKSTRRMYAAMCEIPTDIVAGRTRAPDRCVRRPPLRPRPDRHAARPPISVRGAAAAEQNRGARHGRGRRRSCSGLINATSGANITLP